MSSAAPRTVLRMVRGIRFSDADAVAFLRPQCDYCHEDSNPPITVQAAVFDLGGNSMTGRRICRYCVSGQGLTGWSHAGGGWPNPLGRDEPIPEEGDKPAGLHEIVAALEGRLWQGAA